MGIENGKIFYDGVQVQHTKFFPYGSEFKAKLCAPGRIKVYFCLMQEIQILLMGLPVNQYMCILLQNW